jgi:hypothetical protein
MKLFAFFPVLALAFAVMSPATAKTIEEKSNPPFGTFYEKLTKAIIRGDREALGKLIDDGHFSYGNNVSLGPGEVLVELDTHPVVDWEVLAYMLERVSWPDSEDAAATPMRVVKWRPPHRDYEIRLFFVRGDSGRWLWRSVTWPTVTAQR